MGLEFLSPYYWVKIFHIAFVVAWMAGLLYLPRLFVYHIENYHLKDVNTLFKIMEHRLYYYIMYPSYIIVWGTGIYLGFSFGYAPWLLIKICFVIILSIYHHFLGIDLKLFRDDKQKKTSRYFRLINELPFLILIFILIMVIMKPFY